MRPHCCEWGTYSTSAQDAGTLAASDTFSSLKLCHGPWLWLVCGRDFLTRVTLRDWEAFRQQGVIEKHMTMPTVEPEQFLWLCDRLLEAAGGGTGKGTVARAQGCPWPTYSRTLLGRALLTRFEAEFPSTMALGLNEHSFYVSALLHASIMRT